MKRFWNVVIIAMFIPLILAILDLLGARMWRSLGGFASEVYIIAEPSYMLFFWTFAYIMIALIALVYYVIKRDKSEALALGLIPFILLQFGVEDVLYFFIGGHTFWNATMPWLTNNLWIPTLMSRAVGLEIITGTVLFVSAILGIFVALGTAKYLNKVN